MVVIGCTSSEGFEAPVVSISAPRALTPPDTADDLLFVVSADEGRVVLDDDGAGTLTMSDLDDVTWFSDRPARDAGETTLRAALQTYGWADDGDALGTDAPNATLTAPQLGDALVVEVLTASLDERGDRNGNATFEVRALTPSGPVDLDLRGLDLFIDSTTGDGGEDPNTTAVTERPDPATVADEAGFGDRATLADHVAGLLVAVGAGPADAPGRTVEVEVRASFPVDGSGRGATVPVLLAPAAAPGAVPAEIAAAVERWLTDEDPRADELDLEFDVTVRATGSAEPILVVRDVELPLREVER